MRHSSSSHTVNMREKKMLRIHPFIPDDAWKLSLLKAYRKQIEKSSITHWESINETQLQFSYRQYVKKNKKNGAMHSTLRPWWCLETQLTQSSPKADRPLIDTSPRINQWDTTPILISSIFEKKEKTTRCYAFHPSSLMMWGNSTYSKLTENSLNNHQ